MVTDSILGPLPEAVKENIHQLHSPTVESLPAARGWPLISAPAVGVNLQIFRELTPLKVNKPDL